MSFCIYLISIIFIQNPVNQDEVFQINHILLIGNQQTKDYIIFRELDFKEGDTISLNSIPKRFKENENRILNTGLFTWVQFNLKNWNAELKQGDIEIELKENWYIYPAPIFELADRNFNVWWNEQNKSFSRVNYGLRISHINFSGQKDKLKLVAQFGYARKFETEYQFPYLNKKQTLGILSNLFYSDKKEIGYGTKLNKTQFFKHEDERILLKRRRIKSTLFFRPDLFNYHKLNIEYHFNTTDEYVANELNPNYFQNGENSLNFFKIAYEYHYDHRVFMLYPASGYSITFKTEKEGLGIFHDMNRLSFTLASDYYIPILDKIIIANRVFAKTQLIRDQPAFANNTSLGYGETIPRGYELYVIDGMDYFLTKSSIRLRLLNKLVKYGKAMPIEQFSFMDIKIFLSFNIDLAYVNEPYYFTDNSLNNQYLIGYGPGIDIVLFNNYLFQFEYSFNELGESGLFFHNKISF